MQLSNNLPRGFHVDLNKCETIECENCKGIYFKNVVVMKKISEILSGQKDTISFIQLWRCENCGEISHIQNPIPEETIQKKDKK